MPKGLFYYPPKKQEALQAGAFGIDGSIPRKYES
jgi:hypothetical protein